MKRALLFILLILSGCGKGPPTEPAGPGACPCGDDAWLYEEVEPMYCGGRWWGIGSDDLRLMTGERDSRRGLAHGLDCILASAARDGSGRSHIALAGCREALMVLRVFEVRSAGQGAEITLVGEHRFPREAAVAALHAHPTCGWLAIDGHRGRLVHLFDGDGDGLPEATRVLSDWAGLRDLGPQAMAVRASRFGPSWEVHVFERGRASGGGELILGFADD